MILNSQLFSETLSYFCLNVGLLSLWRLSKSTNLGVILECNILIASVTFAVLHRKVIIKVQVSTKTGVYLELCLPGMGVKFNR